MTIDLEKVKNIYFIGIGGIAMSATAAIAKGLGFTVLGSDSAQIYPPSSDVLKQAGIEYFSGYSLEQVKGSQADLFVISAGENKNNPEVEYVYSKNLPHVGLAELMYHFAQKQLRVVVAGTHGKTTTSGLMGYLLKNLDDSSFMVGGVLQNTTANFYLGQGHYFVFEGDEYKEGFDDPTPKFQYYHPDILVLTNLEFDHPDMFADFAAMEAEFSELIDKMPEDGLIVYNADNADLAKLVHRSNISSVSYAIDNEADFKVKNIQYGEFTQHQFLLGSSNELEKKSYTTQSKIGAGYTKFEVINKFSTDSTAKLLGLSEHYQIQLPGKINVYNALACIAALRSLGFAKEQLTLDLLAFKGIKRRFEVVGVKNGITIIDDYAHHPTAVRETLDAAKLKYPQSKIWAVFEPHTFSRTKATLPDLAKSFDSADEVLISEIYPARESAKDATITSQDVIDAIKEHNTKYKIRNTLRFVKDKAQALDILRDGLKPSDVVIIMAVGGFNRLAYDLKESL